MARKRVTFACETDRLACFVDREAELARIRELLQTPVERPVPVVVLYGAGGMGKSTLLDKVRQDLCMQGRPEYPEAHLPHALVDFSQASMGVTYPEGLVHHVKRELEPYGLQFPRFELILARLRQLQGFAPADKPGEFPVLLNVLEHAGGLGDILGAIRAAGDLDCFKHRKYHRLNIADALHWQHPYEGEEALASAFADDISDLLRSDARHPDWRWPVLLLDGLDWVDAGTQEGDRLLAAVGQLCGGAVGCSMVVGLRSSDGQLPEPLEEASAGRGAESVPVDLIPGDDDGRYLREYLRLRGVNDESHQAIVDVTGGHALWMGVSADIALRIQRDEGRSLTADDLSGAGEDREKLFQRLAEGLPREQWHLLRAACVCRWFDRPLLSAVAGQDITPEAFEDLTGLSLINAARYADTGAPAAWAAHQTVRELALARLGAEGELELLANRGASCCGPHRGGPWHTECLYFLVAAGRPEWGCPAHQLVDDASLEWDRDLVADTLAAIQDGGQVRAWSGVGPGETPWQIASFRGELHEMNGRHDLAMASQEEALRLARASRDVFGEARVLALLGRLAGLLGRHDESLSCHRKELVASRRLGNVSGQAQALANIAAAWARRGRWGRAVRSAGKAMALASGCGAPSVQAQAAHIVAMANAASGKLDAAISWLTQALNALEELGALHDLACVADDLANALQRAARHDEAEAYRQQALRIRTQLRDRLGQGRTLMNMGTSAADRGDPLTARRRWGEALMALEGLGVPEEQEVREWLARLDEETRSDEGDSPPEM